MNHITLVKPDDWHIHLRDGQYLTHTVPDVARTFARAIVMPNCSPPIANTALALDYYGRIQEQVPSGMTFTPLMTIYFTETLTPDEVVKAHKSGLIHAVKWYPKGATTNSAQGLCNLEKLQDTLAAMADCGMKLLIHGESTDPKVDVFDRESVFLEDSLKPLVKRFPTLKIVLEHISTQAAVEWVEEASQKVAATITPHHLWINRNDLLSGGIKPHYYCLPIVKTMSDQKALIKAAISGNSKFFLGTDSAPHTQSNKESACGCAGVYQAPFALSLYAEIFEQNHALSKLEGFASLFGADFYELKPNQSKITLIKKPWQVPSQLPFGESIVIPFLANTTLQWSLQETQ